MRNILVLVFVLMLGAVAYATPDSFRVVRSGDLIRTASPIATDFKVEGKATLNALVIPSGGSLRINNGVNTSTITDNMPVRTVTVNVSGTNYFMLLRTYK